MEVNETRQHRKLIVNQYGEWVRSLVEEGWNAYLFTFMFAPIPGSRQTKIEVMRKEVERAYARSLTRVVRHPHSRHGRKRCPIWIGGPDLPIAKRQKESRLNVWVNDGLHFHTVSVYHPDMRWQASMPELIELRLPRESLLDRVDVEPISRTHTDVTAYALKALRDRASLGLDHLLLLPRTGAEMR